MDDGWFGLTGGYFVCYIRFLGWEVFDGGD